QQPTVAMKTAGSLLKEGRELVAIGVMNVFVVKLEADITISKGVVEQIADCAGLRHGTVEHGVHQRLIEATIRNQRHYCDVVATSNVEHRRWNLSFDEPLLVHREHLRSNDGNFVRVQFEGVDRVRPVYQVHERSKLRCSPDGCALGDGRQASREHKQSY